MPSILNLNRKYNIEVDGFQFEIHIPTPKIRLQVDINVAKRLNGAKISSLPEGVHFYMETVETLNLIVTKYPPELQHLKNWDELEDLDFVYLVYEAYSEKQRLFDEELKKNRDIGRTLQNGNDSRPVHNETIQNNASSDSGFNGSGIGTKDVSVGIGSDTGGYGTNKEENNIQPENQSRAEERPQRIHSGINGESPASRRVLF